MSNNESQGLEGLSMEEGLLEGGAQEGQWNTLGVRVGEITQGVKGIEVLWIGKNLGQALGIILLS